MSRQPPRHVVYKGRWIAFARLAQRFKIFQLLGAAGVAAGVTGLTAADVTPADAAALAAVVAGSAGGSLCMWYYGRRYVGELSLLEPRRDTLRFSVLDVWGNREDVDVPLEAVTPPLKGLAPKAAQVMTKQLLFPVNAQVPGEGRRQFYVSLVAGRLIDAPTFLRLLKGEYDPAAERVTSGSSGGGGGGGGGGESGV